MKRLRRYAAFYELFTKGHITPIGRPRLGSVDDSEKRTEIIRSDGIKRVHMEAPYRAGLEHAAKAALQNSGKFILKQVVTISTNGNMLD